MDVAGEISGLKRCLLSRGIPPFSMIISKDDSTYPALQPWFSRLHVIKYISDKLIDELAIPAKILYCSKKAAAEKA